MDVKVGVIPLVSDAKCLPDMNTCTPSPSLTAVFMVCNALNSLNCTFVSNGEYASDYGDANQNGTGTGMIGAVQRGEFDTFVAIFTPTYRRVQAITFSDPFFYNNYIAVARTPPESGKFDSSVLLAFQWETWCAFLTLLLITVVIVLAAKRLRFTFQSSAARLAILSWSLGCVALSSAYTSALFDRHLTRSTDLPYTDFSSFVECLERARCRLIVSTTTSSHMQAMTDPGTDLGRRMRAILKERPPVIKPIADIPRLILQETRLYYVWTAAETAFYGSLKANDINNEDCKFYAVDARYREPWTVPLKKHSPLLPIFNRVSAPFRENGLGDVVSSRGWPINRCGVNQIGKDRRSTLQAKDTAMFYLFCAGLLAASIAFTLELAMYRLLKR